MQDCLDITHARLPCKSSSPTLRSLGYCFYIYFINNQNTKLLSSPDFSTVVYLGFVTSSIATDALFFCPPEFNKTRNDINLEICIKCRSPPSTLIYIITDISTHIHVLYVSVDTITPITYSIIRVYHT